MACITKLDKVDFAVRIACAFLGVVFAALGLILIAGSNLSGGGFVTSLGIAFFILARKFRWFRIKTWALEITGKT